MSSDFTLYSYFRSSAAFRVRIALSLKGIKAEMRPIHLVRGGGEQHSDAYKAVNPQEIVPTLIHNGDTLTQSLAIMEYLDEIVPEPPLLPRGAQARARVRAIADAVACDIHPLNNLRIGRYLKRNLGHNDQEVFAWQCHWITLGFDALENMLSSSPDTGAYCYGDAPTMADICLIPQMFNARRLEMDMSGWPILVRIEKHALNQPAFEAALPKNQPDAE